jgi:hypothetical protein
VHTHEEHHQSIDTNRINIITVFMTKDIAENLKFVGVNVQGGNRKEVTR